MIAPSARFIGILFTTCSLAPVLVGFVDQGGIEKQVKGLVRPVVLRKELGPIF